MDVDPTNNVIDVDADSDQTKVDPILQRYSSTYPVVSEGELFQLLILHACVAEKELQRAACMSYDYVLRGCAIPGRR